MKFSNSKTLAVALAAALLHDSQIDNNATAGVILDAVDITTDAAFIPLMDAATGEEIGAIAVHKGKGDSGDQFAASLWSPHWCNNQGQPLPHDAPCYDNRTGGIQRNTDYGDNGEFNRAVGNFVFVIKSISDSIAGSGAALAA